MNEIVINSNVVLCYLAKVYVDKIKNEEKIKKSPITCKQLNDYINILKGYIDSGEIFIPNACNNETYNKNIFYAIYNEELAADRFYIKDIAGLINEINTINDNLDENSRKVLIEASNSYMQTIKLNETYDEIYSAKAAYECNGYINNKNTISGVFGKTGNILEGYIREKRSEDFEELKEDIKTITSDEYLGKNLALGIIKGEDLIIYIYNYEGIVINTLELSKDVADNIYSGKWKNKYKNGEILFVLEKANISDYEKNELLSAINKDKKKVILKNNMPKYKMSEKRPISFRKKAINIINSI